MSNTNNRNIIKKLLRNELNREEQDQLLYSSGIEAEMHQQWDNAPDASRKDGADGHQIWKAIQQETWLRLPARKVRFYKICTRVAVVALLVCLSGIISYALMKDSPATVYIASSGIRNIESHTLPDGTIVKLGPGSKLTYPSRFSGKTREVKLDGQGFFEVVRNVENPFIVHTSDMDVEVLGTAFELFAYSTLNRSEAILLNGEIRISFPQLSESGKRTQLILNPNEKIEYEASEKRVTKSVVNAEAYTLWHKRSGLAFENEKLSVILPRMEQWYGRKIHCPKEIAEKYRFTFKVKDETIEQILFMISEGSPIRYTKSGDEDFSLYVIQ